MKKKIFGFIFCVAAIFASSSCSEDRLEIPQKGVVPMESFYITDEDALSALTSVYHGMITNLAAWKSTNNITNPLMFLFNLPGDDVYAACKEYGNNDYQAEINEFRFDNTNQIVGDMYRTHYLALYYCNLVTDNFQYGTSETKDRVISEARIMRAYCYMNLALAFGNPPLVTTVLEGSAKPSNFDGTQADLLRWVAKECEESMPYLKERGSVLDKNNTVIATKGFALGIWGKALLYAEDYAAAMVPLKKLMDSGKYALVSGDRFKDLLHVQGEGCEEKIFEFNVVRNPALSVWSQSSHAQWQVPSMWCWRGDRLGAVPIEVGVGANGWGGLGVREDFAREFVENDGDSPRRKASIISYDELLYELNYAHDTKEDGTKMTLEEKKVDKKRGVKDTRGLYGNGEYLAYKRIYHKEDLSNGNYGFSNYTVMRYAEILLMYAECCAQTGQDMAGGLAALNAIQERSGSGKISSALTLDAVKKEKKFELFVEGVRFFDCVRWGDVDGMKTAGDNIPALFDHLFDGENPSTEHQGYVKHFDYNKDKEHGFKVGKHELFPFPSLEVDVNPNIVQNPGWPENIH